ncbi:putative Zinc finger FYVE domain-containing protein [Naja naja]|nr:putative Zinc finger FYVE domain-containing protein [Naja naja]
MEVERTTVPSMPANHGIAACRQNRITSPLVFFVKTLRTNSAGIMDKRCYGCASKFTVFKKQAIWLQGLWSRILLKLPWIQCHCPSLWDTQQKVCKQCHGELTSAPSQSNSARWSPPENYKKRIAALEAKQNQMQSPQKGLVKSQSQTDSRYRGLSREDKILIERLERLKKAARPKSIPSQAEIESRLAALKADSGRAIPTAQEMEDRLAALQGRTLPSAAPRPVHQVSSSKTQVEQSDDLLNQMAEEVTIDESGGFTITSQEVRTQNWNDLNQTDGTAGISDLSLRQLEEEKTKLLAQAAAELREENTREEKILEVAKRLAVLKGKDPETVTLDDYKLPNSDEEEEEAIQRVLKQVSCSWCYFCRINLIDTFYFTSKPGFPHLTEEAALDEASGFNISPNQSATVQSNSTKKAKAQAPVVAKHLIWPARTPNSDEEELPWCCICNEDATVRCHSCDDDLYCQRCFSIIGKATMSMIGRSTEHLAIILPASKNEPKEQDGKGLKKASARNVFHCASAGHKNQLWILRKGKPILGKNKQLQ